MNHYQNPWCGWLSKCIKINCSTQQGGEFDIISPTIAKKNPSLKHWTQVFERWFWWHTINSSSMYNRNCYKIRPPPPTQTIWRFQTLSWTVWFGFRPFTLLSFGWNVIETVETLWHKINDTNIIVIIWLFLLLIWWMAKREKETKMWRWHVWIVLIGAQHLIIYWFLQKQIRNEKNTFKYRLRLAGLPNDATTNLH